MNFFLKEEYYHAAHSISVAGPAPPPTGRGFTLTDFNEIVDKVRDISSRPGFKFSLTLTFKGKRQRARYMRKLKREIERRNAVVATLPKNDASISN